MTDQAAGPRSNAFVASSSAFDIPSPIAGSTPVAYAETLGEAYLSFAKLKHRKTGGHYLTPASVARFMASSSTYSAPHLRVLDPGSGAGILTASVCEAVSRSEAVQRLHVDTYETDPLLNRLTRRVLDYSRDWLSHHGVALTFDVRNEDFVLDLASKNKELSIPLCESDLDLIRVIRSWPSLASRLPSMTNCRMSSSMMTSGIGCT